MRQHFFVIGPMAVRRTFFDKKGETVEGHEHKHDHATQVNEGSVHVTARWDKGQGKVEEMGIFEKGDYFVTYKDVWHEITALTDFAAVDCIYPHRDAEGNIVEKWRGNLGATM